MFSMFKKAHSNELGIQEGDRFYSDYFQNSGTVTRFISDDEWYFILDNNDNVFRHYNGIELKAQAKPNQLTWIYRQGE